MRIKVIDREYDRKATHEILISVRTLSGVPPRQVQIVAQSQFGFCMLHLNGQASRKSEHLCDELSVLPSKSPNVDNWFKVRPVSLANQSSGLFQIMSGNYGKA